MRASRVWLRLAVCLACSAVQTPAQASEQKCPVVLDHINLSYSHEGGRSQPQLRLNFDNGGGKRISTVTFGLSVLDSTGSPRPYPDDLVYRGGLDVGKKTLFAWDLAPESVDIHRAGETVLVQEVEFADHTSWKDDGSESCVLTVDFRAR